MDELRREREPATQPDDTSKAGRGEADRNRAARIQMDLLRYRRRL
jgi:hypothetical protein